MDVNKATRFLQFFHGEINRLFFNGELEAAIISIYYFDDWNIVATTFTTTDPFIIAFNKSYIEESEETEDEQTYYLTVLTHEMIHQWNAQEGIEDTYSDGTHTEDFLQACNGILTQDGYELEDHAGKALKDRLRKYNLLLSVFGKDEAKTFEEIEANN